MKTFVVNLAESHNRRRHVVSEVERVGLDYRLIVATDGRSLSEAARAELVDEDAVRRAPDWLRPGIIGAVLSHLDVYRAILADGADCALVLEDDVVLPPHTTDVLDALARELTGCEVALLYYRSVRPARLTEHDAVSLPHGLRLLYPTDVDPFMAATAYVITRSACEAMLAFVLPVRAGPDSWGFFHQGGALDRVRCVYPRPFGARTDFKSTIDYLGDRSRPLQRVMTAVSERRIFPFHYLAAWRRARTERRSSQFAIVSHDPTHTD